MRFCRVKNLQESSLITSMCKNHESDWDFLLSYCTFQPEVDPYIAKKTASQAEKPPRQGRRQIYIFPQNFPPPPPWVVPDDDVCVLLPSEPLSGSGFAVLETEEYRNISLLDATLRLPSRT